MKLSIIMPALDEASGIAATLVGLAPLRARGHEVIVAYGGSSAAAPRARKRFRKITCVRR